MKIEYTKLHSELWGGPFVGDLTNKLVLSTPKSVTKVLSMDFDSNSGLLTVVAMDHMKKIKTTILVPVSNIAGMQPTKEQ